MEDNLEKKLKEITGDAHSSIDKLVRIYYFVRDSIPFDLPTDQFISAGEVLKVGRGACMNKAVLLAELARRSGIPARLHFMWVPWEFKLSEIRFRITIILVGFKEGYSLMSGLP